MSNSAAIRCAPTHTITGSGIPVPRPLSTYTPTPATQLPTGRTNYPTNSHLDSKDSADREPPLGAFRYIETAGAITYRPVKLPGEQVKQNQAQLSPLPPTSSPGARAAAEAAIASLESQKALGARALVRNQHPNWTTTNNEIGARQPERFVTEEYRYYPRAHTFTNTYGTVGNFRSHGLNTHMDTSQVQRVQFFS